MRSSIAVCLYTVAVFFGVSLLSAEPIRIPSGHANQPRQPQAAVDEHGKIHVVFGAGEGIYVSSSANGGRTFSDTVEVGQVASLALGRRRGPRIVAGKGVVTVSAIGHKVGNLLAWRSIDDGATWSGPVTVNDSPGQASEGLHSMAIGPEGQIYCAWLDHRNKATQIFGAGSTDSGRTWSENHLIYASPDGNVCECCHPSLAYDANGNLYAMWRNSLGGYRDMYLAVSRDGGQTFSDAEKLGVGGWKLDACPMDGGCLAVSPTGDVTTVWRRENQVFCTLQGRDQEVNLGPGIQPWTTAMQDGAYLTWISSVDGQLWLLPPGADRPRKLAQRAMDPMLGTSATGRGPVVAVWEAAEGESRSIYLSVVAR